MKSEQAQLYIELAARAPIEILHEEDFGAEGYHVRVYRFDTRHIVGDFILVRIALPFATEEAARAALLNDLLKIFS